MHRLLKRQIKRKLGKDFDIDNIDPKLKEFIEDISNTYEEYDRERRFIEHTLDLNSQELYDANRTLEKKVKSEVSKNIESEKRLLEQSKMASMGEMIGNIAHQWRQPLTAISALASSVKLQSEIGVLSEDEIKINMDKIVDSTMFLSETIETFRDFIRDNKEKEKMVLQDSINNVISILSATLKNNGVRLINDIDKTEDIELYMVSGELSQVIINIINNAKDVLVKNDQEDKWIKIMILKHDDNISITIEDNGGGIPNDIIDRVFEPYFTTKHQSQGTGLGLHMSQRIIKESFNGWLHVKNTSNGAKFFIDIPLVTK